MADKINIFIVDDSAVIRKILTKIISSEESFNIVGEAEDGQDAVEKITALQGKIDMHVVLMDIEMPRMDGFTAMPLVKRLFPKSRLIVASTLTQRGTEASFKALSSGASDYIPKPNISAGDSNFETFSKDLLTKARILGKASQGSYLMSQPITNRGIGTNSDAEIKLVPLRKYKPKAIAVGSSTGGPEALQNFFKALNKQTLGNIPIFITQHMPAKFTTLLAATIKKNTGFECIEGAEGEIVMPGKVYLAPGDFHMRIERSGTNNLIRLNQEAPINFCRPSVDPMLNSLIDLYGEHLLFVMLTGMGSDGLEAAKKAASKNICILAQDKETATVWGMPGAVAKAGICSKVAPIPELAYEILGRF